VDKNFAPGLFASFVLQTSVVLFSISSQFISTNTRCQKQFWSSYETLERTGEMKLIMKFCLCLRSLSRGTFLIYFLAFPCEYIYNIFSFHFKQLFISLAFNKYKKDSNILKIILVQGFCSIKTEIARFPIGFRLNM